MNKYLGFTFFILFISAESYAEDFYGYHEITKFNDENNVIKSGAYVQSKNDAISIDKNVFIENYGEIHGNIDLNGNSLGLTNTGVIDGKIINTGTGTGAVRQNISTNAELQKIQIGSNVDLYAIITDIKDLSVDKLKSLNAQNYEITDSDIYINDLSEWNSLDANVSFLGMNNLYFQNVESVNSGDIVKYVNKMQNVNIKFIEKIDNLHNLVLTKTNSGALFNIVRETDYNKIFKNDIRGDLLETLRSNKKDKSFMSLIDSARNMQEIESIMNKSYHFNHKFLIRPLFVNNNLLMLDSLNQQQHTDVGFNVNYTGGNKINGFGGKASLAGKYDNLFFGIGLNVNKLNYKDNLNNFDMMTYSPNLKFNFNKDNFWVNGNAGFSLAKYRANNILYNDGIKNNPRGRSEYGILDFGYDFDLHENLKIGVFSGGNLHHIKVLDINNTEKNLHIGSKIKYSYELIGIKYEMSGLGLISSNSDLMGSFELGFFSVLDEISSYLKFDAYKNQYDLNYQASINVNMIF